MGQIGFYAPLFPASPTPWMSGPGPGIPFPFLMTIQGIIEESPGVFVPTKERHFERRQVTIGTRTETSVEIRPRFVPVDSPEAINRPPCPQHLIT